MQLRLIFLVNQRSLIKSLSPSFAVTVLVTFHIQWKHISVQGKYIRIVFTVLSPCISLQMFHLPPLSSFNFLKKRSLILQVSHGVMKEIYRRCGVFCNNFSLQMFSKVVFTGRHSCRVIAIFDFREYESFTRLKHFCS